MYPRLGNPAIELRDSRPQATNDVLRISGEDLALQKWL